MRALLLLSPNENAIFRHRTFMIPPLSLGVLASILRTSNHHVQLVDLNVALGKWFPGQAKEDLQFLYAKEPYLRVLQAAGSGTDVVLVEDLLSGIDVRQFDIVGISLGSDFSFLQIHLGFLIGAVLQARFGKQVVFGGSNVTFLYLFKEFFRDLWRAVLPMFRYIIKGPGEVALLSLLSGRGDAELPGRLYMADEQVCCETEARPIVTKPSFDTLDMRLYESYLEGANDTLTIEKNLTLLYRWPLDLAQLANSVRRRLQAATYERKIVIPYVFNYGCPFRCAFCSQSGNTGKPVIAKDAALVVEHLVELKSRWQSGYFYFLNNAFNSSPRIADRFCEKVVKDGIRLHWSDCGRFNSMTEDRVVAMAAAGCRKLTFGFESGSPWMLRYIDKRIELDQAERVLEWCSKHGIWVDLEVIVGLPYETDERMQETLDFLLRNRSRINSLAVNAYFVVPSSLMGLYPQRYGLKLVREHTTYAQLLAQNYQALLNERDMTADNFRIYRFDECEPYRQHRDIDQDTRRHMDALLDCWGDEFKFGEVAGNFALVDELLSSTGNFS